MHVRWHEVLRHGAADASNRLFHGDNLHALAVLAEREPGSVQCVYIDPPYNRGTQHTHYGDARSRSAWLEFMARRLVLIRQVLQPSGSLFVQLDDNELDYLKVLLDEIFGPDAHRSITIRARAPSAFSTVNRGCSRRAVLLWYARSRADLAHHPQRVPRPPDPAHTRWIDNLSGAGAVDRGGCGMPIYAAVASGRGFVGPTWRFNSSWSTTHTRCSDWRPS